MKYTSQEGALDCSWTNEISWYFSWFTRDTTGWLVGRSVCWYRFMLCFLIHLALGGIDELWFYR